MKVFRLSTIVLTLALSLALGLAGALAASRLAARAVTVATARSGLGRILVDGRGRTLYLFEKDTRSRSACYGSCAKFWPALLARGTPSAGRGAKAALLGLSRRSDGSEQVTYAGHPLYRFQEDTKPGQTKGEGSKAFGAGWDVLSPAGKKIERGG
jgi:predicted lipoprotein with Yx(FWY)xxD motif